MRRDGLTINHLKCSYVETIKNDSGVSLYVLRSQPLSQGFTFNQEIHCETEGEHRIHYFASGSGGKTSFEQLYKYADEGEPQFVLSTRWFNTFTPPPHRLSQTSEVKVSSSDELNTLNTTVDDYQIVPSPQSSDRLT